MLGLYIFIIGLCFGSFFDVVGMRLPAGESIVFPGSHCPKCNHYLKWYENIPLFSYLFLRGKCSSCKTKISVWYPLIELLCGLLFLLCYFIFGISSDFFISIIIASILIIIIVSDTKYMIILDSPLVICGLLIFLIKCLSFDLTTALISLLNGLLIFIAVLLMMFLGNFIFKRESLGGGDIKLSFIAGMVLGFKMGIFYIVLAAFLAFPYAIYITIKGKDSMLPFGPFLASSIFIIFINMEFFINFIDKIFIVY